MSLPIPCAARISPCAGSGSYIERGVQRHPVDAATRFSLVVLARLFDWRDALAVVQPATMIRWHRAGWRLLWRMKSRAGRPAIPMELRELIRRLARQNFYREPAEFNELFVGMEGQHQDAVARH